VNFIHGFHGAAGSFTAEEYFIKITPSMGMAYTRLALEVVDPIEGGNLVQNCQQRQ
jgi:hypothetical protein